MPTIIALERQFAGQANDQWRIRMDDGREEYIQILAGDSKGALQRWIDRTAPVEGIVDAAKAIRSQLSTDPDVTKVAPALVGKEITAEKVVVSDPKVVVK